MCSHENHQRGNMWNAIFNLCASPSSLSLWCVRTCMLRRMYFNGVSSGFQGLHSDFARIRNVKGAANMPSDFVYMHTVWTPHTHTRAHTGRRAAKTAAVSRSAFSSPLCMNCSSRASVKCCHVRFKSSRSVLCTGHLLSVCLGVSFTLHFQRFTATLRAKLIF